MSKELINHSHDLKQLQEEGFELEVFENYGYAIVHHVPYVNENCEISYGKLISNLALAGGVTAKPDTHVIYFEGTHPCNKNGSKLTGLLLETRQFELTPEISAQFSFSNRPPDGYVNYYDKFTRYIDIISAPARSMDGSVTARTYRNIIESSVESVFQYVDTNSSKSNIAMVSNKLAGQKIGIIGLGGTGSYIVDLVAKTPVSEIHLYDGDVFLQHNAFRSPGAATKGIISENIKKTKYFTSIYSNMHKHVISHDYYIQDSNIGELAGLDFVFISIDNGESRKKIINFLVANSISFIDTGLGVDEVNESLLATIRVTACTSEKNDHITRRIPFSDGDGDIYASNIQISDLNAINAIFAVMKWKKICGFYQDLVHEYNNTFDTNTEALINDEFFKV